MKKISAVLVVILGLTVFAGCGSEADQGASFCASYPVARRSAFALRARVLNIPAAGPLRAVVSGLIVGPESHVDLTYLTDAVNVVLIHISQSGHTSVTGAVDISY